MAKQAGLRPSTGAAGVLRAFRGAQNVPRSSFEAQQKQLMWPIGLGRYHGKAGGTPSKASAEGFEVLRLSKAAAEVLRVLRGAQNVARSSFEAQ